MGDTLITIVAIVLAAVLMFVFPLMTVSDRGDDISQLAVQNTTVEYVDSIGLDNGYVQELGEHEEEYVPKWNI